MKHKVLIVDDEIDNLDSLERIFRRKYTVLKASSGQEGLEVLKQNPVSIILSDQKMPNMVGTEFLTQSIALSPNSIRLLLTGYTDIESIIDAINSGEIYKYLTKPWDPTDLLNTVDKAVEKLELKQELQTKNEELQKALVQLQELDENKNNFMILINHELKTPLTVIQSYSDLLKESKLNEEQSLFLKRINDATQRLNQMIHRTLSYIELKNNIEVHTQQSYPLKDLITHEQKNHPKLTFNNKLNEFSLNTNSELFKKLLHEIYANVHKYSSDQKVTTSVSGSDQQICIEFINKADHLKALKLDHLLKPFYLNEEIMNHSGGLGLGLGICQELSNQLGINLSIVTKDNQFIVKLLINSPAI